jgi:hypothetical protein
MFFSSTVRSLGPALLPAVLLVVGCSASTASVATATQTGTGCASEHLSVFNYNKSEHTWLAACDEQLFVCAEKRGGATCTAQKSETLDPALVERVRALKTVPKPQRDAFISADISAGTWDEYARTVGAANKLKPGQVQAVSDLTKLYTEFSPAFDAALTGCIGAEGVATVAVASNGGLNVSPNKSCLMSLRSAPDLAPLRQQPNREFYLASGVRDVKPIARPVDPAVAKAAAEEAARKAAEPPPPSALSIHVRAWLDAAAKDIAACADAETVPVTVNVDAQGVATVTLREDLAGTPAEGCVRSALPQQTFEPGPEAIVHLVRKPVPTPEELAAEEAKAKKGKKKDSSKKKDSLKKEDDSTSSSSAAPTTPPLAPAGGSASPAAPSQPASAAAPN